MKPFWIDHEGIGHDLKQVREALGITMKDIATISGIAVSHIWNIEGGKKEMSLEKFFTICSYLAIPPGELILNNLHIDQSYFYLKSQPEFKEYYAKYPQEASETATICLANYVSGACVVLSYCFLVHNFSVRLLEFPSVSIGDAFSGVAFRIDAMGILQKQRHLSSLLKSPVSALIELGLFKINLITDFLNWAKEEAGKSEPKPWRPVWRKNIIDSLNQIDLFGVSAMGEIIKNNPSVVGEFFRKLDDEQEKHLVSDTKQVKLKIQVEKPKKVKAPAANLKKK